MLLLLLFTCGQEETFQLTKFTSLILTPKFQRWDNLRTKRFFFPRDKWMAVKLLWRCLLNDSWLALSSPTVHSKKWDYKMIYRFSAIPSKIMIAFCTKLNRYKSVELQKSWISKAIYERRTKAETAHILISNYCWAIIIKPVWYCSTKGISIN